jgi:hypothetical protein
VSSPGTDVPGTRVSVPRAVQSGAALEGIAPSGSLIEVDGTQVQVGHSGRFAVTAPSPRDEWQIRIIRPAPATPLVFSVQVLPPALD